MCYEGMSAPHKESQPSFGDLNVKWKELLGNKKFLSFKKSIWARPPEYQPPSQPALITGRRFHRKHKILHFDPFIKTVRKKQQEALGPISEELNLTFSTDRFSCIKPPRTRGPQMWSSLNSLSRVKANLKPSNCLHNDSESFYQGPLSSWQQTADIAYIESDLHRRTRRRFTNRSNVTNFALAYSTDSLNLNAPGVPDYVPEELGYTRKKKVVDTPPHCSSFSRWFSRVYPMHLATGKIFPHSSEEKETIGE